MRHHKHSNQLGVKKEHRLALMANLASALIREGRIQTTLKKAKALRPFAERLVTLAKKGGIANRRLVMARIRDVAAVKQLFDDRSGEFTNRQGGYTRIYKLGPQRRGDAAEMAIIEFVPADDPGYRTGKRRAKSKKSEIAAKAAVTEGEESSSEVEVEPSEPTASAEEAAEPNAVEISAENEPKGQEASASEETPLEDEKVDAGAEEEPGAEEPKKTDDK